MVMTGVTVHAGRTTSVSHRNYLRYRPGEVKILHWMIQWHNMSSAPVESRLRVRWQWGIWGVLGFVQGLISSLDPLYKKIRKKRKETERTRASVAEQLNKIILANLVLIIRYHSPSLQVPCNSGHAIQQLMFMFAAITPTACISLTWPQLPKLHRDFTQSYYSRLESYPTTQQHHNPQVRTWAGIRPAPSPYARIQKKKVWLTQSVSHSLTQYHLVIPPRSQPVAHDAIPKAVGKKRADNGNFQSCLYTWGFAVLPRKKNKDSCDYGDKVSTHTHTHTHTHICTQTEEHLTAVAGSKRAMTLWARSSSTTSTIRRRND